jgi:hypothetical protein
MYDAYLVSDFYHDTCAMDINMRWLAHIKGIHILGGDDHVRVR